VTKAMTAAELARERELGGALSALNSQLMTAGAAANPSAERIGELSARLERARFEYESFEASLYAAHPELRVRRGEALPFEPASGEAAPMHEAPTYEASVQEASTHEASPPGALAPETAKPRRTRNAAAKKAPTAGSNGSKQAARAEGEPGSEAPSQAKPARTARKSSARTGRSRKSATAGGNEH